MSVMGSMLKPKKTEITDKLRQEINKVGGEGTGRHRTACRCSPAGRANAWDPQHGRY